MSSVVLSSSYILIFKVNRPKLHNLKYLNILKNKNLRTQLIFFISLSYVAVSIAATQSFSVNQEAWHIQNFSLKSSPVDLTFLNENEKPAGKHGFLKTKLDKLVFEDGTSVRFWGTNLTAYTLFSTDKALVKANAKRLSAQGYNLVRLHHHDSPWVNPNIFGENSKNHQSAALSETELNKLDWWIKCLKDEGIYVWLDLHVARVPFPEDHLDGNDEILKSNSFKGYNYLNSSVQLAMRKFNVAYLNHVNIYTKLAYKDEPAIATILITNENDLTQHFGNLFLPDKHVPYHSKIFMSEAKKFALKNNLDAQKIWRTWEPGIPKLFLNDLEHRFNQTMINQLHTIGVKVPIVTTSYWGDETLASIPSLTDGDMIDVHTYKENSGIASNPIFSDNITNWISSAQVIDKPISVSEWNISPFPARDRHLTPLFMASQASLHGWDSLMQYAYSQDPLNNATPTQWMKPDNWNTYTDPAYLVTMPMAAILYRQQHVQESNKPYVLKPSISDLMSKAISPITSLTIRTLSEKGKVLLAMPNSNMLPWLTPSKIPLNGVIIDNFNKNYLDANAVSITSNTSELERNWVEKRYEINTPKTQAVVGSIAGKTIKLNDISITSDATNVTIGVQSLDDKSIKESKSLMISFIATTLPTQGKFPFVTELLNATILVTKNKDLKLFKTNEFNKMVEQPLKYENNQYVINIDNNTKTHWLYLNNK